MIELKQVSALEKVLLKGCGEYKPAAHCSGLKGERVSWQVMYTSDDEHLVETVCTVDSPIKDCVTVRRVGNVPVELAAYPQVEDPHYLSHEAGLYPDVLYPLRKQEVSVVPKMQNALWITAELDEGLEAGTYPVTITLTRKEGEETVSATMQVEVIDAVLPQQQTIYTQWFHTDCIADYYGLEVFSEEHWEWIEKFIRTAVHTGINMLLTPLFTPPLDTEIGGERRTVQLVEVEKNGNRYKFGFDKLRRWIDVCKKCGIRYYEMSHLFTQWGAKYAPKIVATENGEEKKIFGWDTNADSPEYAGFLHQFLPELIRVLKEEQIDKNTFFHISDEPSFEEHKESYAKALSIVADHLKGFTIIDALSNYEFYKLGLVKCPIPANNHIEPFLENQVPGLWTYYCCSQGLDVSNRFLAMPSYRTRIIGAQLYKYDIKGFLQWGYNFYYTRLSKYQIDPFATTDGECSWPAGDPFSVYPGKDQVLESIRSELFYQALQDVRAMQLLESKLGKDEVVRLVEEGIEKPITFKEYPHTPEYLLELREKINCAIQKA